MASGIASRAASAEITASLWKLSITSFLRNLSTSSSTPNAAAAAAANPTTKASSTAHSSKRKKKKNLFEVAQFLPNWGIGYHMAKTHWANVSYEITKINLYKDGRHGKAWGIAYKDACCGKGLGTPNLNLFSLADITFGSPAAPAKKISGVHKRCWRYILNSKRTEEITPKPEVQVT